VNHIQVVSTCLEISSADSIADLATSLRSLADLVDCHSFSAVATRPAIAQPSASSLEFLDVATGYPDNYQEMWQDTSLAAVDPVMQSVRTSSLPLVWGGSFYKDRGDHTRWDRLASYGMRSVGLVAMHMPSNHHLLVGFDASSDITRSASWSAHMSLLLPVAAAHTQTALDRMAQSGIFGFPSPGDLLTTIEVEVIKWTSIGKTAWEVGQILAISEATVNKHLQMACSKWRCSNKLQLVSNAIRLAVI
jgi:DNA-binding CsgD family transcriptional regulator